MSILRNSLDRFLPKKFKQPPVPNTKTTTFERLRIDGKEMRVLKAKWIKSQKDYKLLLVTVHIVNKNKTELAYNANDYKIQDDEGNEWTCVNPQGLSYNYMESGQIPPREGVIIKELVFRVPKNKKNLILVCNNSTWVEGDFGLNLPLF